MTSVFFAEVFCYTAYIMLLFTIPVFVVYFVLVWQALKNTKKVKRRSLLKGLISFASICFLLNAPLGFLGYKYVQHFQSNYSGCPNFYPYVPVIIILNVVGLISLIYAIVLAYNSNNRWPCFLLIGASIMVVVVALSALLASSFCLTF